MEIVDANAGLLTNLEVLRVLEERDNTRKELASQRSRRVKKQSQQQVALEAAIVKYLKTTPCATQTEDNVRNALTSLKEFRLTPAERMSLINLRATKLVEIHLIVEECDERMTHDQTLRLRETIEATLPQS